MKVDNIPDDIENARHQGHVPREYFLCMPWVRQIKVFCKYLREGCLPFQALEFSEKHLNDSENDGQMLTSKHDRQAKSQHLESAVKTKSVKCSAEVKPSTTQNSKKKVSVTAFTSAPNVPAEKKSTRKRSSRRRQRVISSDSLNNSFSDASVELSNSNSSHCGSASINARRSVNTKELPQSRQIKNSNFGSSDSGYSDHSDQNSCPDSFRTATCKRFSHPCDFDSLMSQAILALSQIQVDVAACTA